MAELETESTNINPQEATGEKPPVGERLKAIWQTLKFTPVAKDLQDQLQTATNVSMQTDSRVAWGFLARNAAVGGIRFMYPGVLPPSPREGNTIQTLQMIGDAWKTGQPQAEPPFFAKTAEEYDKSVTNIKQNLRELLKK